MTLSRNLLNTILSICVVFLTSCAKTTYTGRVFSNGQLTFSTGELIAPWQQVKLSSSAAGGPLLAFHHSEIRGSIDVNARCGKDKDDVPLAALTNHLLIGFTERTVVEEKLISLDAREALRTVVQAKLDGVFVVLDLVVLKKDGCVYDFVFVVNPERYKAGKSDFERFFQGFSTRS